VQVPPELNPPVTLDEVQVTVPVGEEPVTVAVQVELEPAAKLAGEQETDVVVDPRATRLKSMSPYAVV